ncbi:MAG TPA: VWA domain-containing protein [Thermoanaerobaculia bacterium]|nr:VWA domain-containing protein [Thermoanaerobaculia bacterium]
MRRPPTRTLAALVTLAALLLLAAAPAAARKQKEDPRLAELAPKYRQFLEEVDLLLTEEERQAFLDLEKDYQRDAYIEQFWRIRDPYPNTTRNELRDRWEARVEQARSRYGSLRGDRPRMLLLNGPPDGSADVKCGIDLWPIEVWYYGKNERLRDELYLIFYQRWGVGDFQLWQPAAGIQDLFQTPPFRASEREMLAVAARSCSLNGDAFMAALAYIYRHGRLGYPLLLMAAEAPIEGPSGEWLATFQSYSTDLPEGAALFPAELSFGFPGRKQSRTVVQGTLLVAREELSTAELGGARSLNLLITGELLREDRLFDRFRYKFDLPLETLSGPQVPLVFQRHLRPGDYRLVLKAEDLNGDRYHYLDRELSVPLVEDAPPPPADLETAAILAEANAILSTGDTTVTLVEPIDDILVGKVRFDALVTGNGDIASVVFSLDGQPILRKRSAPWSVELDLGRLPRSQVLRAAVMDSAGKEVAADEMLLNASAHRFTVRLVEPRPGQHFRSSLRAVADVEAPEGQRIERVELYLDETLVATLYQPPYEQPLVLPTLGELTYLRAVAYLPDGNSTDDHVFVNAPPGLEEIDVQLVELYTSAIDRSGRPVEGLGEADFRVREDGAPQEIVRFEQVRDLPIKTAVLLDISASMASRLEDAQEAALAFFQQTLTPKDRAALITFNDRPQLVAKFTNRLLELGGGLAGLKAERGTALYDSLIFALHYFNGVKGQRALLVLSDGKDETSRFGFEETLEYARRAGVTVYTIGLALGRGEGDTKKRLTQLAEETGGRSYFVDDSAALREIYYAIEKELRSQYLIAYQSTNTSGDGGFRRVQLEVERPGVRAQTMRGYYP